MTDQLDEIPFDRCECGHGAAVHSPAGCRSWSLRADNMHETGGVPERVDCTCVEFRPAAA